MTRSVRHRGIPVLMVLAAVAGAGIAGAPLTIRQTRQFDDAPGTWKPWQRFSAAAGAQQEQGATPALVKSFEAELLALNAILRRSPAVAPPIGFSVET